MVWRYTGRGPLYAGALALALVVESITPHPHYLPATNVFFGGVDGAHRVAVDSASDWGQDLPALRDDLQRHPPSPGTGPVHLAYFGNADLRATPIPAPFWARWCGAPAARSAPPYGSVSPPPTTSSATPVQVPGLSSIVSVAIGLRHSCAREANGSAWCWGQNGSGKLGDGTTMDRHSPVQVEAIAAVIDLAGGYEHSCAVTDFGLVGCWGGNAEGQLGIGVISPQTNYQLPVLVTGLSQAVQVGASLVGHTTCASLANGAVWCWGYGGDSQLGDATRAHQLTPVPVVGF